VEVEEDRHAGEAEGQGGEDEGVRQGVDLDEGVAAPAVGPNEGDGRPPEEGSVLGEVGRDPGPLVALDVEPTDAHAVDDLPGRGAGPAEGEDVDRATGGDEGLGLAPDAGVFFVVGVADHGDGAPARAGHDE
jgi:hypothetical protein